jgi:hypothetical protein
MASTEDSQPKATPANQVPSPPMLGASARARRRRFTATIVATLLILILISAGVTLGILLTR